MQTMTDDSSNTGERSALKQILAYLQFPLALFPLVALLTYDWRSIEQLNSPALPSTNWIGALGDGFAYYGYLVFGLAVWMVPAFSVIAAINLIRGRMSLRPSLGSLNLLLLMSSSACILQVMGAHDNTVSRLAEKINLYDSGGAIGYIVMTRFLSPLLSDFGSSVLMCLVMTVSLVTSVGIGNIVSFFRAIGNWAASPRPAPAEGPGSFPREGAENAEAGAREAYLAAIEAKEAVKRQREADKAAAKAAKAAAKAEAKARKEELREQKKLERAGLAPAAAPAAMPSALPQSAPAPSPAPADEPPGDKGPYILPSVSLLDPLRKSTADHGNVKEMSQKLIDTLKLFGVDASLAYTIQGPVVTKYAIQLAPGTRYSAVTNISDNLMGALRAVSLRIEAPIPGEEYVGIEVPNRVSAGISFREIIESDTWRNFKGELPLLFGKDAAGNELVADLAKMPHMLVAGATGQGKSVCLNAIINGLLMTKTSDQLKLIMVDPKSVEFTSYVSLPHLIVPIITDNRKVIFSLHWAVAEMEKRLKMFARAKVRNIYDFNHRLQFTQTDMFGADSAVGSDMPRTVPYIVIIIDEVADLMAAAAKEVTPDISRLTAKARAAGIHLILATQRPDAKVITGTIKANILGRVAFKTATSIDSRTILDDTGAENLIGKGDMLFRTAEGKLIRAQGAWLKDEEIERITGFIEQHSNPEFDQNFKTKLERVKEAGITDPFADNDDDPDNHPQPAAGAGAVASKREIAKAEEDADNYRRAIECIINTNRASTSHFQRRLGIGYNNAAKIIDKLEEAGIIGPQVGAGPRQIIMDQEQLMAIFNGGTPAAAAADVQPSGETAPGETQDELFNEEA
jgi:S-DNA-T family DNA segregation ATPase FtsK/SpoIIIE